MLKHFKGIKEVTMDNTRKIKKITRINEQGDIFEIFEKYLHFCNGRLAGATLYDLNQSMRDFVFPFFKTKNIKDISKLDILDWQNWLDQQKTKKGLKNLSTAYKNKIRFLFQGFLNFVEEFWGYPNVLKAIKPFKDNFPQKEMDFYTYPEFCKFIKKVNHPLWRAFFCVQYFMGFRFGETCALCDNDIDFYNKTIQITKSVSRKSLSNFDWYVKTPKNKSSIRKVIMPQIVVDELKKYMTYKKENNIPADFLFGGNKPLVNKTVKLQLNKYAKLAKLRPIRIHDFRHSNASFLINYGANIMLVSKRLGHCNTNITLKTYAKLFPNAEQKMISKINKISL